MFNRFSGLSTKAISEWSLEETISHNASSIESLLEALELPEIKGCLQEQFNIHIESGGLNENSNFRPFVEMYFPAGFNVFDPYRLVKSYFLTMLAWRAFKNNQPEKAWPLICEASEMAGYSAGMAHKSYEYQSKDEQYKQKLSAAKAGGEARAQKYKHVQEELIRLMKIKKPEEGWWKKKVMIAQLLPDMEQFVDQYNQENHDKKAYPKHTLSDAIFRWLREVPEVRATFEDLCKKNKR